MKGYMFGVIIDKPVPLSLDGENHPSHSKVIIRLSSQIYYSLSPQIISDSVPSIRHTNHNEKTKTSNSPLGLLPNLQPVLVL